MAPLVHACIVLVLVSYIITVLHVVYYIRL